MRNNQKSFQKYICIIVDAFSTGRNLPLYFKGQGYSCIHVQSSSRLPYERSNTDGFNGNFIFDNDIDALLEEIRTQFFGAVIKVCLPGSESGVALADLLSEKLGLASNGSELSHARRNKYDMVETVSKAKLKTVKHIKSVDPKEINEWVKREEIKYPIVLKPLGSANGDGVYFCNTEAEIVEAHAKILGAKNYFNELNTEVLAESMNSGQEYIVNTATAELRITGEVRHFVTEVWRVDRRPSTTIYEKAEIIYSDAPEYKDITQYTKKVLDALGIKVGAATTELKYTKTGGPVLIETAARIMGGAPLSLSNDIFGYTQLSMASLAYLNPDNFFDRTGSVPVPKKQVGMDVFLVSTLNGQMVQDLDTTEIEKLKTLHSYIISVGKGSQLPLTVNSLTSIGEVYLLGIPEDVEADYRRIREIEPQMYEEAIYGKGVAAFPSMPILAHSGSGDEDEEEDDEVEAEFGRRPSSSAISRKNSFFLGEDDEVEGEFKFGRRGSSSAVSRKSSSHLGEDDELQFDFGRRPTSPFESFENPCSFFLSASVPPVKEGLQAVVNIMDTDVQTRLSSPRPHAPEKFVFFKPTDNENSSSCDNGSIRRSVSAPPSTPQVSSGKF